MTSDNIDHDDGDDDDIDDDDYVDGVDEETFHEDFLDCTGRKRRFRLQPYATGRFLDAVEMLDGEPVGMRFAMTMDHTAWGRMRDKFRTRLAERDVVVDPDTGKAPILCGLVRADVVGEDETQITADGLALDYSALEAGSRSVAELLLGTKE